jgi:hypothetical protein
MFDTIFENVTTVGNFSLNIRSTLIGIFAALVLGLVICVTYLVTMTKRERSASFILSLIILPAIVAIVILLIGGNLARAFSMAGIFTIVRFRSIPGDAKDISYVFLSMAVGLSIGLGYLTLGAVVTVIISAVIVIVNKSGFGITRQKEKRLRIMIPEDMNYEGAFDDLFTKYTDHCELQRVRTTNMGTLFEISYDILMKKDISEKEFIDSLRCRNGNLTIQLAIKDNSIQQL